MGQESQIVEKVYEDFDVNSVNLHECSCDGITYSSNELTFQAINFKSGLLSFDIDHVDCSIGTNQLKKFVLSGLAEDVNYNEITKFKFVDCLFSDDTFFKKSLDSLIFEECIFQKDCFINNQDVSNNTQIELKVLKFKKIVFNSRFKLNNAIVDFFQVEDIDFVKDADFFRSIFKSGCSSKISFDSVRFNELALFGETEFLQFLEFRNVTFKGYAHFKSALLHQGLDLEFANIEKEINFFDLKGLDKKQSIKNTSQETYRIVKSQLQKVGNAIESNKYHSLELEKRRETLPLISLDYLILFLHKVTSNHSQNWLLPILWIFYIGFITCAGINFFESGCCCYQYEDIFKYMSILNFDHCLKNEPVVFLLNKVALSYLYYQFITATRKDTRK